MGFGDEHEQEIIEYNLAEQAKLKFIKDGRKAFKAGQKISDRPSGLTVEQIKQWESGYLSEMVGQGDPDLKKLN